MIVTDIRIDESAGRARLSGLVRTDRSDFVASRLAWTVDAAHGSWLRASADPFLASLLLPAMRLGEDLRIEAPVSARLLGATDTIMDIYAAWVSGVRRPSITCDVSTARPQARSGGGLFFSCGVDSFYSLLKDVEGRTHRKDGISHLILIGGFDVWPGHDRLFGMLDTHASQIAAETGRELAVVQCNARQLFNSAITWDFYHGAVLAGTAHALGGVLGRCVIPSTHTYAELLPWGSDPLLDPLWSTEGVEVIHDGCETTRTEKVQRLAQWPLALQHLRVCWPDWIEEYNCGRCEKCIRTMIALHVAGALPRSGTFPRVLDPAHIRDVNLITGASSLGYMVELLDVLKTRPEDKAIARAVAHVVAKERRKMRFGPMLQRFPRLDTARRTARHAITSLASAFRTAPSRPQLGL